MINDIYLGHQDVWGLKLLSADAQKNGLGRPDLGCPVRLAIAGLGLVGRRHAEAIKHAATAKLCAIADPKAEAHANEYAVPHYPTIEEMMAAENLDGIILSTPTPHHAEQGRMCIEKGIPVLIEKPLADDLDAAERLVRQSESENVPILVGHHRRYNPIIERAHAMISDGRIGDIRAVHATCWFYKPEAYFDAAPWRKQSGAGPVSVNLVHDIDLIRHLCGEITHVQAQSASSLRGYENEELAAALLRFENGGIGTVSVSDSIVSPWSWEYTSQEYPVYPYTAQSAYQIGGSHGALSVPDLTCWSHNEARDWWSPISSQATPCESADPLVKQIEHFANVIRGIEQPRVSGREGLRTLSVINAIQVAARTGQKIQLCDSETETQFKPKLTNPAFG